MKEEVRNKIAATKGGYTDPRAMQEGFQRGASATPRELMQQEFLETKSKNHSTEMPEVSRMGSIFLCFSLMER